MKWGIWDTKDHCWLGDDNGPKVFDDDDPRFKGQDGAKMLARCAAEINDIRMGWALHRSQVRVYTQLKDSLTPRMTTVEALKKKLSGEHV